MIDLSRGVRALHHRVRLNAGFRSDLKWWGCFLPVWNGSGLMYSVVRREPQVVTHLGHGDVGPLLALASGFS